ncbi:complement C1q-like protein 4 [Channa argus]|uniref:complement C1q-like protein 4 n=1 Tax=Channa argus TaxID=215402 RepID=UPI002946C5E8|nr:hypothetical protein Q8A73_022843 [Channa argus]
MKMIGSLLLLLLVCSISTVQIILPPKTTTKAPVATTSKPATKPTTKTPIVITVSPQPLSLQSISATVKQLSTSLAQQKVEIQFLQRQTKAQAVQLQKHEVEIRRLQLQRQVRQVAFSASLSTRDATTIGPFPTHTALVFKHVVTNIGGAYNLNKGVFTAPIRGVYRFEWHVGAPGNSYNVGVHLVKNKDLIANAYEVQSSGYASTSQSVTLILQAKDVVFLRLWSGSRLYDNANHQSTFSGHLLFTI